MMAQPIFHNALVEYWHPSAKKFMLEGQSLIGLLIRGEPSNLRTFPPRHFNIKDYINMCCEVVTEKVGSHVPVHKITILSL
jgi:hypothetical protein